MLKGFLNNKTLIIFTCIFGSSVSFFFALNIWLSDGNNRVSTALALFFAATGYWAKTKYELENKSKSILELEQLIESNKKSAEKQLEESLDKLEIETKAANTLQDNKFETLRNDLTRLEASLESHLMSVGHIETEKRLSELTATTQVLRLNVSQISKEYEGKELLKNMVETQKAIIDEQLEFRGFLKSHGFKPRTHNLEDVDLNDE